MQSNLTALVSAFILGACVMIFAPAYAQDPKESSSAGDKYGYSFHQTKADVFTDGAHGVKRPDPYTDGASIQSPRNPFNDGAHASKQADPYTDGAKSSIPKAMRACGSLLAGMDRTGVSAPPAHADGTSQAQAAA